MAVLTLDQPQFRLLVNWATKHGLLIKLTQTSPLMGAVHAWSECAPPAQAVAFKLPSLPTTELVVVVGVVDDAVEAVTSEL